ncbi:O-linked N-acetylglucosamine transferase, SPINDLY family protein [Desulfovibrio sp. TomC]|uniref:O-linked N-acetylglucosamine transferase, SPINDLY family protein n=1 Tax=Desulfovibrio sp. TomC TaxID=1562888 RepID=UPI0005741C16|nr:glycosyl transferase [Desulfovibrio sp. TomC]KHK00632.1 TPR domain protein, putative component of TonB system [Desulfovibrio sp. TomC]
MSNDVLSPALIQSMVGSLSVPDLIRTTETFKQSGQAASVEAAYAAWIGHNPDDPLLYAVLFNYSVVLSDVGKLAEAQQRLEQAIALNADFMPAYINLGRIYERQGKVGLAIIQWSAALARMAAVNGPAVTHKTTALNQSARALEGVNQDDAAENMLRESLELDGRQREVIQHLVALRQRQCKWPVTLASERVERSLLVDGMSPLSAAAYTDDPLWQLALADHYNKLDVGIPAGAMTAWPKAVRNGAAPLRIGYLSSDLREHAVGYLMHEVFGLHDRSRVEVFAYYCGIDAADPLHRHFQATADHFVPISQLDDAAAAKRIADDGIHILVDLNGYTRDARLKLVALRPAPIIVNWLGYPGTMASPYHHYLIADDWIIPASHEAYYSEKILRLPCYQPSNRNRTVAPDRPGRAEAGLPEDAMVYCCFNGAHKIHHATFERWLAILARVPGSVLWLLGSGDDVNARLRAQAQSRGIDPERLVFAPKAANPAHLARYALADLFLDTTPYGAHTTASDALWTGVPVLTVSGRSFASRVCGSLVHAAGLPELVCDTVDAYVERAVALGNDPAALVPLRQRLAAAHDSAALFDMPGLVAGLEGLYETMWQAFAAKALPRPDLANLDVYLEVGSQFDHEGSEVQRIEDYQGWWAERLARRNQLRPISRDRRLATDPAVYF